MLHKLVKSSKSPREDKKKDNISISLVVLFYV